MNENPTIKPKLLPPLTKFIYTIGALPTSYLMSMTYEEQLVWLCNYLGKEVIPAINQNGAAVEELQQLYTDLQSYVDNYFDNLDIQTEVNNKIDAMYEAGTLQEIITEYLQISGVLGYNTVADMSEATNLIEGSICRTLGQTTYDDGKGAFYKVRTITSEDVVDGYNIVALDVSNTLIAEKIPDILSEKVDELEENIDSINSNLYKSFDGKVCYFGDSYSNIDTCPVNWCDELTSLLGLTSEDVFLSSRWNGSGFLGAGGAPTWGSQLQSIINQTNQDQRNKVKAIIIGGGFNDRAGTGSDSDLITAMSNFNTLARANFPNATIYLAFMGWTYDITTTDNSIAGGFIYNLQRVLPIYSQCGQFGWKFLENVQWVMHDLSNFQADKVHPNTKGSKELANAMYSAINGSCGIYKNNTDLNMSTLLSPFIARAGGVVKERQENGNIIVSTADDLITLACNSTTFNARTFYPIVDVTTGFIIGDPYLSQLTNGYVLDTSNNSYPALIGFVNGQFGFIPLTTISSTTDIKLPKQKLFYYSIIG